MSRKDTYYLKNGILRNGYDSHFYLIFEYCEIFIVDNDAC